MDFFTFHVESVGTPSIDWHGKCYFHKPTNFFLLLVSRSFTAFENEKLYFSHTLCVGERLYGVRSRTHTHLTPHSNCIIDKCRCMLYVCLMLPFAEFDVKNTPDTRANKRPFFENSNTINYRAKISMNENANPLNNDGRQILYLVTITNARHLYASFC